MDIFYDQPDEILVLIIDQIDNPKVLMNLGEINVRLHNIIEYELVRRPIGRWVKMVKEYGWVSIPLRFKTSELKRESGEDRCKYVYSRGGLKGSRCENKVSYQSDKPGSDEYCKTCIKKTIVQREIRQSIDRHR